MKWLIQWEYIDPADNQRNIGVAALVDSSLFEVWDWVERNTPIDHLVDIRITWEK